MKPIVRFDNLTLGYGSHAAVHHLSGLLAAGSLTAVLGANGSGKSTLLKGVVGLIKPMDGSVKIAPETRIAYLPQQSEIDRSFPARVIDLVALGLWPSRGLLGRRTAEDNARIATAIRAVGLTGFETRPIDTLSGGQMQRALFARVMLQNASLILLDEPFNAVDQRTITHLLAIIAAWRDQGRTIVAVLHDFDMARQHFPQTMLLARRPVAWGATADVLTPANLEQARTFDEAWQDDAPWCGEEEAGSHQHGDSHEHAHAHTHHDDGRRMNPAA